MATDATSGVISAVAACRPDAMITAQSRIDVSSSFPSASCYNLCCTKHPTRRLGSCVDIKQPPEATATWRREAGQPGRTSRAAPPGEPVAGRRADRARRHRVFGVLTLAAVHGPHARLRLGHLRPGGPVLRSLPAWDLSAQGVPQRVWPGLFRP